MIIRKLVDLQPFSSSFPAAWKKKKKKNRRRERSTKHDPANEGNERDDAGRSAVKFARLYSATRNAAETFGSCFPPLSGSFSQYVYSWDCESNSGLESGSPLRRLYNKRARERDLYPRRTREKRRRRGNTPRTTHTYTRETWPWCFEREFDVGQIRRREISNHGVLLVSYSPA